jgi:hypothetical protein
MGGIKLHAAIDVLIARNRIHNTGRGLWLDWMAQGTRVTRNLCYDNTTDDLFVEVNHGPFLVDNNVFLSPTSLRDWSQGGAYAHNLFTGVIDCGQELRRFTPFHPAHATSVAGRTNIPGGDNRWYNNIFVGGPTEAVRPNDASAKARARFVGFGLWVYDTREHTSPAGGNVYYRSARPSAAETGAVTLPQIDPQVKLVEEGERVFLQARFDSGFGSAATKRVSTERLGRARVSNLPFENSDGSPVVIDTDYFGQKRSEASPSSGPFENPGVGQLKLKVW